MKRLLVLMSVALLGTAVSLHAQKVDEAGLTRKIDKLESDSKDPSKGAKPGLWIDLGKAYYDAATAPTSRIYRGMDELTLTQTVGKVEPTQELSDGQDFLKYSYPYLDVYVREGSVANWTVKKTVGGTDALQKSAAAYTKAYELDKSKNTVSKAEEGTQRVIDALKQRGDNLYARREFKNAAQDFSTAYEIAAGPVLNAIDTAAAYNAGLLYAISMDFAPAEKYLGMVLGMGYDVGGDAQYYLYHAYSGQEKYKDAQNVLMQAVMKYPQNSRIVEGLLDVYAQTGDDPNDIIPLVQQAITADPNNPELYAGLGRVYDKLGQHEKAIEAFNKSAAIAPNDFGANFNVGLMLLKRADEMAAEFQEKPITSKEEYDADLQRVYGAYALAIPSMEKAHAIQPNDIATVELLKNVYFRLRDESPEMMNNYNKYNELFKSLDE